MRNERLLLLAALLTILMTPAIALADVPLEQSKDFKDAKVKPAQARAAALKAFAGSIVGEELERENGGSGLRYSFDIRHDGAIHEVGIDAITGDVLENSVEGPSHD